MCPRHLAPTQDRVTETGYQHLWHVTHIWDQSLRAQQYILRRSHGQVTKVPGQAPTITTEYSADIRYRTTGARVCLHIQKPKPQECNIGLLSNSDPVLFGSIFDYWIRIQFIQIQLWLLSNSDPVFFRISCAIRWETLNAHRGFLREIIDFYRIYIFEHFIHDYGFKLIDWFRTYFGWSSKRYWNI